MSDAALGVTVMWTADPEGRLTFASSNLEELTGHPLSHFSGAGWNEVIHPEDLDRFRTEKQAILDDPRPFQVNIRFETPAGTLDIAAAGNPIYNAAGIVLGYVGTWTDVTRCRNKNSRMPRLEVPSRNRPQGNRPAPARGRRPTRGTRQKGHRFCRKNQPSRRSQRSRTTAQDRTGHRHLD